MWDLVKELLAKTLTVYPQPMLTLVPYHNKKAEYLLLSLPRVLPFSMCPVLFLYSLCVLEWRLP